MGKGGETIINYELRITNLVEFLLSAGPSSLTLARDDGEWGTAMNNE